MEVLQDTYKDTKIGRIPKDWEVKTLEDVFIFNNGKGHEQFISENGDYIVVNSKFISQEGRVKKFSNKQMSPLLVKDITMVMSDIPNGRALAKCFLIEENNKYSLNQRICGLRLKNEANDDVRFFFYNLNRNKGFLKYNDGVSQTNLRKSEVLGCLLAYPPSKEQQKIADILSTVDEQISTTDKIIEKSKELKKGLMQKLFSEGLGHTEFKDTKIGRIPKDWKLVKIGEVTKIKVGRDLKEDSFSEIKTETHKYPVFSNTVSNNGFYGGYYNFAEHIGRSLTIVGRGVGIGTSFSRDGGYGAIGRLLVLFPNDDVNEIFMSNYVNHKMTIHYEDGGIPQLTGDKIYKYLVVKPNLNEQIKIAAILSEADAKIEKEQEQKAQLEQLKKGLMQQLLTGKKRVKV
tara:strand:- start:525 stop:1730 length:1206 start_codon:yes stop_codon:yes gene_type:complete